MVLGANCDCTAGNENLHVQGPPELIFVAEPGSLIEKPGTNTEIDQPRLLINSDERQSPIDPEPSLSPILRLPPELLSVIFNQCLPQPVRTGFQPFVSRDNAPLLLERVCRQWRAVAWSTPGLWSSISLILYHASLHARTRLIKSWLARSGQCPLSISLLCYPLEAWDDDPPLVVLDAIAPYSHRWRDIDFRFPMSSYLSLGGPSRLPLLKKLRVASTYPGDPSSPEAITRLLDIFSIAPQLQVARLYPDFSPFMLVLPWSQLTRLSAERICVDGCFEILRQSINLIECAFRNITGARNNPHPPVLRLAMVSTLKLKGIAVHVKQIMGCLTLPALSTIDIEVDREEWPHAEFLALITRSSCTLECLSIRSAFIDDDDLIECLRHTPSLVRLKLKDISASMVKGIASKTIHALTRPGVGAEQSVCLASTLRHIELTGAIVFFPHMLATMLSSRWGTSNGMEGDERKCVRLQSFRLVSKYMLAPSAEVVTQLQAIAKEGMRIQIKTDGQTWLE